MFIVELFFPGLVARVEVAGLLLGAHGVLLDVGREGGQGEDGKGEGGEDAFHDRFLSVGLDVMSFDTLKL